MTYTFHIDDSSEKAKALLEFLRTLDFVKEDSKQNLTKEHMAIAEQRRANRMSGKSKTYSWNDIKDSIGEKKADQP